MANIIGEVRATAKVTLKEEVEKVYITTLKKDTTHRVDYRKATILLSNLTCSDPYLRLFFNTAVEICELMYSRETSRCQRALLKLHNLALHHAVQCVDMFYSPKSISKEKNVWKLFPLTFCPCSDCLLVSCTLLC